MPVIRVFHKGKDITDDIINGGWDKIRNKPYSFKEVDNIGCVFHIINGNDKLSRVDKDLEVFVDGRLAYQSININPFFNAMRTYG